MVTNEMKACLNQIIAGRMRPTIRRITSRAAGLVIRHMTDKETVVYIDKTYPPVIFKDLRGLFKSLHYVSLEVI